jgi:alpha-beta hydrolase superfamily lysophospholipase
MDLGVNGACAGVKDMLRRLEETAKNCPDTKFAFGGHSQGGSVTMGAIPAVPKELLSKIVAATNFGSRPCLDVPQVQGRCKSFYHKGDNVSSRLERFERELMMVDL